MTVIAYSSKHRMMAADSRCSSMSESTVMHLTHCQKIVHLKSGALLGLAGDGDARDLQRLLERARPNRLPTRRALAELESGASAILAFPTGEVFLVDGEHSSDTGQWTGEVIEIRDPFVCIGSGASYAYGALEVGATPADAVRAACRRDLLCGLPLQWEKFA